MQLQEVSHKKQLGYLQFQPQSNCFHKRNLILDIVAFVLMKKISPNFNY